MSKLISTLMMISGFFFCYSPAVHAYLDPGTGSMILQGIIASVAIGFATIKMWWYKVAAIFGARKPVIEEETDDD
ncbi:MAG: hypothetical protein KDI33_18210 [Halioglobus sp.]|nr:hypothetical protein [Halioglobus sp.]